MEKSNAREWLPGDGSHQRDLESCLRSRSRCVACPAAQGLQSIADCRQQLQVMAVFGIRSPHQGQIWVRVKIVKVREWQNSIGDFLAIGQTDVGGLCDARFPLCQIYKTNNLCCLLCVKTQRNIQLWSLALIRSPPSSHPRPTYLLPFLGVGGSFRVSPLELKGKVTLHFLGFRKVICLCNGRDAA